jgi:hypothetical protein
LRKYNIANFNKLPIGTAFIKLPANYESFAYGSDRDIAGAYRVLSNVLIYCRDYKESKNNKSRLSDETIYLWLDMMDKLHRGPDNIQHLINERDKALARARKAEKRIRKLCKKI